MNKELSVEIKNFPKLKKNAHEKVNLQQEFKKDPKYKTEMCKSWQTNGFCVYGNKCRFAHGRQELFDKSNSNVKYKQKHCSSFYQIGYCLYGARCHFKHYDKPLKDLKRSYYSYLLNAYNISNDIICQENPISNNTWLDLSDLGLLRITSLTNSFQSHSRSLSTTSNDSYIVSQNQNKGSIAKRLNVFCNIPKEKSSSKSINDDSFDIHSNSVIFCQNLVS